jgi:hypothetical protein
MSNKEEIKEVIAPTPQDFQVKYEALCKEMGMLITPELLWIPRDDGTFSTKINLVVSKLPQEK